MIPNGEPLEQGLRYKVASLLAFLAVAFVAIAPQRAFVPKTHPLTYMYWSLFGLSFAVIVALLLIGPQIKLVEWKTFFKRSWPLLASSVAFFAFVVFGYFHQNIPAAHRTFPDRWWMEYALLCLLLAGSFLLGFLVRWSIKKQAVFMGVVFGITTILVIGEYLYGSGISNPIGQIVTYLNHYTDRIWQWSPMTESLRVTALYNAPTLLAMLTLAGMAWAVSARMSRLVRTVIFLDCLGIMVLTASRAEFLAVVVLLTAAIIIKVRKQGIAVWLKRALPVLIIVVGLLIGLAVVFSQYSHGKFSAGLFTRVSQSQSLEEGVLKDQPSKSRFKKFDELSSGRLTLWIESAGIISQFPFGTRLPSGAFLERSHSHNDFIEKYVQAGPIGVLAVLLFYWWMATRRDKEQTQSFGLLLALTFGTISLLDCVFAQSVVMVVPLFLLGLNADFSSEHV